METIKRPRGRPRQIDSFSGAGSTIWLDKEYHIILIIAKQVFRQPGTKKLIQHLLKMHLPEITQFVKEQEKTSPLLRILSEEQIKLFNESIESVKQK